LVGVSTPQPVGFQCPTEWIQQWPTSATASNTTH